MKSDFLNQLNIRAALQVLLNYKFFFMEIIKLPRLRLAQLQTVTVMTIKLCKSLVAFASSVLAVENAFEPFKEGMKKHQTSAEKKSELDVIRDTRLSGLFAAVFTENKFPNEDEAVKTSHAELLKIMDKYGTQIRKIPRDEETAEIDNLLEEIGQIDITPLESAGIPRWIPVIAAANDAYKQATDEYLSDSVQADATDPAGEHAPALEKALEKLYLEMFATIVLSPNDELINIYSKIEALVDSMR